MFRDSVCPAMCVMLMSILTQYRLIRELFPTVVCYSPE